MNPIRTLIVDDEPLGRKRIRQLLEEEADVEIVAECANGREAVSAIREHAPDLLFLDVQMPLLDGFDVLQALDPDRRPVTIFVTAYDQYALRAFEVHALDYLLKPFDRARFQEALQHARKHLQRKQVDDVRDRLAALLHDHQPEKERPKRETASKRLAVKTSGKVLFVDKTDIDWIEAAGNYVKLHTERKTHLLRETMSGLQEKLDPAQFLRIHRSTIVNVDRIESLEPLHNGEYRITLHDGTHLKSSRSYRDDVQALIS